MRNWREENGELDQNMYEILNQTEKDTDMDQGGDRNFRATWTRPRDEPHGKGMSCFLWDEQLCPPVWRAGGGLIRAPAF